MSIFSTLKHRFSGHSHTKKAKSAARLRKAQEQKAAVDKEKDREILKELLDKGDRKNG